MALIPYAHEKITTLTSSTALTAGTYNVAKPTNRDFDGFYRPDMATVTVETADIRFTVDGTPPTVTVGTALGHLATSGTSIELKGFQEISQFLAINAVASSGSAIRVTYYRN